MKKEHKTSIGGQALIEGVMMRGVEKCALAVRSSDGTIKTEEFPVRSMKDKKWFQKAPIIRGIFSFIESMLGGYKCLMRSTELSGFTEIEAESKFDKWLEEKLGDKLTAVISVFSLIFALLISIGLFMLLPTGITTLLSKVVPLSSVVKTIIESLVKIGIFVLYLFLTSLMKDLKRVYRYHGAEHKTIFCYEKGLDLTVENVRKMKRFHPRCGTSFIIITLIISILVMMLIPVWDNILLRVGVKLLSLPIIVGISYELIKIAGRYDNVVTRIISYPGVLLQHITTKEPDDDMIECAITAVKMVLTDNPEDDRW